MRRIHRWPVFSSHKGSVMRSLDDLFVFSLKKPLNKQSICWWFEGLWWSCNNPVVFDSLTIGSHVSSTIHKAAKLPWIFLGAPLKVNGGSGKYPGQLWQVCVYYCLRHLLINNIYKSMALWWILFKFPFQTQGYFRGMLNSLALGVLQKS